MTLRVIKERKQNVTDGRENSIPTTKFGGGGGYNNLMVIDGMTERGPSGP